MDISSGHINSLSVNNFLPLFKNSCSA